MTEIFAYHLGDIVAGRITLTEFRDWFIDYIMGPIGIDPEDISAADDIENAMAEFTGGHISEQAFREVLRQHYESGAIIFSLLGSPAPRRWSSSSNRTERFELRVANR